MHRILKPSFSGAGCTLASDHALGNEALDAPLHGRRRQSDLLVQHFSRQRSVILQRREKRPILVVNVLHKRPC
jgi:hypothetical protein